jgi:signal transduction histidine kinase
MGSAWRVNAMGWLRRDGRVWLPSAAAFVCYAIALGTASTVYDLDATPWLVPIVAAGAAVPIGFALTRPLFGWILSFLAAVSFAQLPVRDGDPWPWPVIHGLVLLFLLAAVIALASPQRVQPLWELVTKAIVWLATATLFAVAAAPGLRAGWAVGASAFALLGAALRLWLPTRRIELRARGFPTWSGWRGELSETARVTFVAIVPSPAARPIAFRRRTLRWAREALPWLAAFAVFWIAQGSIHETLAVADGIRPIVAALIALPVGQAGNYALIGWRLVTALALIVALIGTPSDGNDPGAWPVVMRVVWIALLLLVSLRHPRPVTLWAWLASVLVMSLGVPTDAGSAAAMIFFATAAVALGDLLRTRRQAAAELAEQAELSELEKARRTVLEEKTRIARDLHDVVAHHMSMVVVQAESAPYRITDLSDEARAEFTAISGSAREALTEIRALLGVLRSDGDAPVTTPQPRIDDIADLVEAARRSGVPVELMTPGEQPPIGTLTSLSAFRIVQEALANVARHAPGTTATVALTQDADALRIHVRNSAPSDAGELGPEGHGITGMRERAAAVGGTLQVGPTEDGGFDVTAVLPLDQEDAEHDR